MKSQTITQYIDAPLDRVYAFVSREQNLALWAPIFFRSVSREGDEWVVDSPLGRAVVEFTPPNPYGVLDHTVRLASGAEFFNPMRLVPNGSGCEIMFTLFQADGMSDLDFARDAVLVKGDLNSLRKQMEAAAS